jgi:hypothetical protein
VIHVRNNGGKDDPDAPGTTGWELIHDVARNEASLSCWYEERTQPTATGSAPRRK